MTEYFERGREAEQVGSYGDAGMYFAMDGFEELVLSSFDPGKSLRVNACVLLRSVSCDVRAGNIRRAECIASLLDIIFKEIDRSTDDDILHGMTKEWTGDAHLMIGTEDAMEWYSQAEEMYANAGPVENRGFDEEVLYAQRAITNYLESVGKSLPENSRINFKERIQAKLNITRNLNE